jgi:RNA polymerase sigma-70 factor, ECF subfamily
MIRDELPALLTDLDHYARKLTRNTGHEDLMQDTIVRALEAEAQFQPRGNPTNDLKRWLYTIMRNLFFNERRRQRMVPTDPGADVFVTLRATSSRGAADELLSVAKAMSGLVPGHQAILLSAARNEATYGDMSAELGINVKAVKSRLHRARVMLGRAMV